MPMSKRFLGTRKTQDFRQQFSTQWQWRKTTTFPSRQSTKKSTIHPPWNIPDNSVCTEFSKYPKSSTSHEVFKGTFAETSNKNKTLGWRFLFTDASKTEDGVSYAVVNENGMYSAKGLLLPFTSIFTAEAFAILKALQIAGNGKTIIFTDSLSSLTAIENINNNTEIVNKIRDELISKKGRAKLIWIPGHTGIKGNEDADAAAKKGVKRATDNVLCPQQERPKNTLDHELEI